MKHKLITRSAFLNPHLSTRFSFRSLGVLLALIAFALYPGGTALAQNQTTAPTLTGPLQAPCTSTFTNSAPITINDVLPATPYPSNIAVTGVTGTVTKVTVTLTNMNHTFPDDIDILLVGPSGQNAIIMSDAGAGNDLVSVTLTFDDFAATGLPDDTQIVSGTFQPTNFGTGDTFPAPAPAPSGGSPLSVFNGTNPNGTWSLYVVDDLGGDTGSIDGGWEINVTTACPTPPPCTSNFSNPAPITINDVLPATPYPSNIAVAGMTGTVSKVTVTLNNMNHTFPDDVDVLLVGPGGQNAIIMSDAGGQFDLVNTTLTFDDAAPTGLPDFVQIASGRFQPTNFEPGDPFAAPAPAPSGGSALSVFNGTDPNGTWSLYVVDDLSGDTGSIDGGWDLTITAACPTPPPCTSNFPNPAPITINDAAPAAPYPSTLAVAGLTGTVTKVTVTLTNITHTYPDDIDILLVGPSGQNAIIMSDAGGGTDLQNITITLDDAAPTALPDEAPIFSGRFRPANFETAPDPFPVPAPAPSGGSALSVFNGTNPNGTWLLYIVDDFSQDTGTIAGGWALDITTTCAQALNISTRMQVQTGENVLIGGFIVAGNVPKSVVVRGIGPSLIPFGIPDALADPTLELHGPTGALILQNNNWQDDPSQAAQLTALGLGLLDVHESGIFTTLPPNAGYTAILAGNNGGTGVGLVEIYDVNQWTDSHLANISTRGLVQTGNNVMIGGFILGGDINGHIAILGKGPSLAAVGVSGVLPDPTLALRDNNGTLVAFNDNCLTPPLGTLDPLEACIEQFSLPLGAYTAILAGANNGTGVGLVEVYNLH